MFKIKKDDLDKLFDYGFKFFGDSYCKKVTTDNKSILYVVDLQGNMTISYFRDCERSKANYLQDNNIIELDDTIKLLLDNNIIINKESKNDK